MCLNVALSYYIKIDVKNYEENQESDSGDANMHVHFSFKIHKVAIRRPWMDTHLFNYPNIGIKGKRAGSWSSGYADTKKNHGSFPLLPTQFLVAKDIQIDVHDNDMAKRDSFAAELDDTRAMEKAMVCTDSQEDRLKCAKCALYIQLLYYIAEMMRHFLACTLLVHYI